MARLGDDGVVEGWDKGDPPAGVEAGEASGDASEGLPGSVVGRGEILRGLVGDPGRLELGVRSTKSSGRLDAAAEWSAEDQAGQAERRDPYLAFGFVDPERRLRQGLEVRSLGR